MSDTPDPFRPHDERPSSEGVTPPPPGTPLAPGAFGASPTTDAYAPTGDVLASEPPRRSRTKAVVIGVVAVLVVVLAGGAAIAARLLSGGGAQPETALPASAMMFAKIDLDPSAGQKIDAFRFLNKFPAVKDKANADEDLIKQLVDAAHKDGQLKGIDYDRDIKPWLGKRAAVAVLPPTGSSTDPVPVVAIQITDPAAARAGLDKLAKADGGDGGGFVVGQDYAVLAETQEIAKSAADAAAKAPLSEDKGFAADMKALGDTGIATGWVDLARFKELVKAAGAADATTDAVSKAATDKALEQLKGRMAMALRFDGGDAVELAGSYAGGAAVPGTSGTTAHHIAELPESTVAAVSIDHADAFVGRAFDQLLTLAQIGGVSPEEALNQLEAQTGLKLPDDLKTLAGSNLLVAVDGEGLSSLPKVGVRTVTDPVKASAILAKVQAALADFGQPTTIPYDEAKDGIVIGSTPDYVKTLAAGNGTLGKSPRFTAAVRNSESAQAIAYVDLATLLDRYAKELGAPDADVANLKPLAAVGMTAKQGADGSGTFSLRLTTR